MSWGSAPGSNFGCGRGRAVPSWVIALLVAGTVCYLPVYVAYLWLDVQARLSGPPARPASWWHYLVLFFTLPFVLARPIRRAVSGGIQR